MAKTVKPDGHADTPVQCISNLLEKAQAASADEKDAYIAAALDLAKNLDDYLTETTTPASSSLRSMIDDTMTTDWDELHKSGKTKYHYTTNFCAGTYEAQFVATLCQLVNATRVLEVGMFTGTTAAAIAAALPEDGKVTT
ncbi:protein of unknown function, partial [Taphrina deformans PYCC 5710]